MEEIDRYLNNRANKILIETNTNDNTKLTVSKDLKIANIEKARQSIELVTALLLLPEIDIYDEEQVKQRVLDYIALEYKMGNRLKVSGLAAALNIKVGDIYSIVNDLPTKYRKTMSQSLRNYLKKVYRMFEVNYENNMVNGGVNPIVGIFIAKNHFGYRDQVNHVVEARNVLDDDYSIEDVTSRYIDAEVIEDEN